MIGNSDDETNFPHKLLLTNKQVLNIRKAFANYKSTDYQLSIIKLLKKKQFSKIIQSREFLVRFLGPKKTPGLPLMKSVTQPLGKSVLIPLGLTAAASAADAGIQKKS